MNASNLSIVKDNYPFSLVERGEYVPYLCLKRGVAYCVYEEREDDFVCLVRVSASLQEAMAFCEGYLGEEDTEEEPPMKTLGELLKEQLGK